MNTKQKVLHLMTSLGAGGAETNLLALLGHFDRDKFEHAVAYGGENGPLESEFKSRDIKLIRIAEEPLGVRSLFKMRKMISRIKQYSPDIIHSHLDLTNVIGLMAKKSMDCQLVIHFHGLGMIPHHLLPNRPFKHRMWNLAAKKYNRCDKAIAICNFQLPFLKDLGFTEKQIAMIPNGISLDKPVPKAKGLSGEYSFVNVGRFQPQKDHAMLIDAFQKVVEVVADCKLVLVGDGELRETITEKVKSMGLANNVEFLGVRRDIPDILANNNCFVLGSRWELHPITILEAMRAGLPVIASDVGGIADTVDDGNTGLLIEAENTESLANAMIKLAKNPEQGVIMGQNGEKRVQEYFNNELVARQIESVYQDVLGEK